MNNNLKEIYELHEQFQKHEYKWDLICECGLIKIEKCYADFKDFILGMKKLIAEIFRDEASIIPQIADINLLQLKSYYYMERPIKNIANLFASYGIQNFKPEVVEFIIKNADEDIIINNGDISFILKQIFEDIIINNGNISFILKQTLSLNKIKTFKRIIKEYLKEKGKIEDYKYYIKRFRIDDQGLLFKIPFELYDKIKITKFYYKHKEGDLDENVDIDDLIKKMDYILNKYKNFVFKLNVHKSIIEKLISKKRYDLAFKLNPGLSVLYFSQNDMFSEEELEDIRHILFKTCEEFKEAKDRNYLDDIKKKWYYVKIKDKIYKIR